MTATMSASLRLLNRDLVRFARRTRIDATRIQRKTTLQLLIGAARKTRVDTGRARGGWQVDVGGLSTSAQETKDVGRMAAEAQVILKGLRFGQVTRVFNNVDYIVFLEEGTSRTTPDKMLQRTVDEVRSQFT